MSRFFFFLVLFVCLFSTCREDDDPQPTLPTCPEGDTYSLDLSTSSFFSAQWIWLSEPASGELAYQTGPEVLSGSPFFLNFEEACQPTYTLSIGVGQEFTGISNGIYAEVRHFAEVPNGSGINEPTFNAFNAFNNDVVLVNEVTILNCPPYSTLLLGNEEINQYTEYNEAGRILRVNYPFTGTNEDYWLALRSTEDGNWYGQTIAATPSITFTRITINFNDLGLLTEKSTTLLTDDPLELVEVRIITNSATGKTANIGAFTTNEISLPLPESSSPVLFKIKTKVDESTHYETQQQYDIWPTQVQQSTHSVTLTNLSLDYPTLSFTSSGADLIVLNSKASSSSTPDHIQRSFISPVQTGDTEIILPSIGRIYQNTGNDYISKYESSFQEGSSITAIHYPLINGSYTTYLRSFWGFPASRDRRLAFEYEKLIRAL